MNISEIKQNLSSHEPRERLQGLTALQNYDASIVVPLLASLRQDQEMTVRLFVAMQLGYKQSSDGFRALAAMLITEPNANVRAEIAGALLKYGQPAIPHVVPAFYLYPDWLMRTSILLGFADLNAPEELFQLCIAALADTNSIVQETGIDCLTFLVDTLQEEDALLHLLAFAQSKKWQLRRQVALALRRFTDPRATEALGELRQDEDYRVVAAVFEGMLTS